MGCGSSQSIGAVPGSSNDYKYSVLQTWDKVDRTISKGSKVKKNLVVQRSGWKTVRVFVSSTFKDFHAEREILVKEVFPDLRVWCESRRLHLVECDLRWGIPKNTDSGETLRLCLGEIDRCYQDNVMPFFLNLTSERCGWIPSFDDVPETIVQEYRWVHGLSVTEMEILHGAYRIDNPNSFFMIRKSEFLSSLPSEYRDDFIDPNPIAFHKMTILKKMLKSRLGDHVLWYDCEYDGIDDDGKISLKGLDQTFCKPIFEFFKKRIAAQYPVQDKELDPYQLAREAHESFMKNRGGLVLGRNTTLDMIKDYVVDIGIDYPFVILGGPGTGKSAVMARVADVAYKMAALKEIPGAGDQGWHVFFHFVGAIPGSTDLEKCLKRLLKEIGAFDESTIPKNLEAACQLTYSTLSNPKTKPVIIVIDALNQFDDDTSASILSWLPRKLAPQIRVILSMIDETPPHRAMRERGFHPKEYFLTPLDVASRKEIVTEILGRYNKRLDEEQMSCLIAKESSQNPLWLSIACEELRIFGLFSKINDKINSLSDGLLDLLEQVFDRFEEENGGSLLIGTLCLLETSETGLLETELLQILGDEDNLMPPSDESGSEKDGGSREKAAKQIGALPAAKWAMVFRALKPFLRPFGDSGEGRLDFYHRALSKAVRRKYFPQDDGATDMLHKLWWHNKLADYFFDSDKMERKVEELPMHLIKTGDKERLQQFLCNWEAFDLLYVEIFSDALLKYWREGFGSGWQKVMLSGYEESLRNLKNNPAVSKDVVSRRHEQITRVMVHAGAHEDSFKFLKTCISMETELGERPERMVEVYSLAADIYDDKLKLYQWIERWQITELGHLIKFARQSIAIRETLPGRANKFKLGRSLTQLAFNLEAWMETGADNNLSGQEAIDEGKACIERAIQIFKELGNDGFLADAIMTKGILLPRGDEEQLEVCMESLDMCLQAYGENSVLSSRLFLNIGIFHEDNRNYRKACEWFIRWHRCSEEVFGYHHPKTERARKTLARPQYKRLLTQMEAEERERQAQNDGNEDENDLNEMMNNVQV
ncbi:telomerase protein component 1-like [Asterias rubens]|uniref:telomerase protein component 1-like n=1 Tax=Asterias rubens TaxID=7604 RepID=UPI001454F49E|nr:telomerase protein component 1-like [Asterias rubens]XP_033641296.1 telomerase protein component 1-like [Asterias rubens]XP_033641297.1 telomerase protein component 1-like [Asterias rubens]